VDAIARKIVGGKGERQKQGIRASFRKLFHLIFILID